MTTPERPRLASTSDPSVPPGLGWHEVDLVGAPFKLARFTVEPGCSTPLDTHEVSEVWFVARGSGELRYDGDQLVRIGEGDALYLEPPRTHEVHNDGDDTLVVHSIYWPEQG
jgi:mannose-6-phosphate isomerase-like protein (cupin superfamily)